MQRLLDADDAIPSDAPTRDEQLTPAARAARQRIIRRTILWDKNLRETLEARFQRAGLTEEDHRNDATVALAEDVDGWHVRWVLADQGSRLVVRSVHVEPSGAQTPPGGLNADSLRALSPASAASRAAGDRQSAPSGGSKKLGFRRLKENAIASEPARPGRPTLSDDFLASVAVAYLQELPKGKGLLRRVGSIVAPPHYTSGVPDETVRDWVHKARRRGFLGPAPKQGARGGSVGPRLEALLAGDEREQPDA